MSGIYKIRCYDWEHIYMGQTDCTFKFRFNPHKKYCKDKNVFSYVVKYMVDNQRTCNIDNLSILNKK